MDIVITYVNGLDPEWQKDYARMIGKEVLTKRYRDWGTLPYLFRGIENCMPFIENVFLVVARESQVPAWVNRKTVKMVLHEDIMPAEYLPVFNSTAIEMFLHRIEGLSEEYIYLNDDFFPLLPCEPTDFFQDGKAATRMAHHLCTMGNLFRIHTKRSDRLARNAADAGNALIYIRPQHTCAPMLRSVCEELFAKCEKEIRASISPVRAEYNYNQYIFTDYAYFTGRTFRKTISNRHISMSLTTADRLTNAITKPTHKIACINDTEMSEQKFMLYHEVLHKAFQSRFPNKSRFEL